MKTFRNIDDFKKRVTELKPEDLAGISGGRDCTSAESSDWNRTLNRYEMAHSNLLLKNRYAEAEELSDAFYEAYMQWENDLNAAADGEGKFFLSKYTAHIDF